MGGIGEQRLGIAGTRLGLEGEANGGRPARAVGRLRQCQEPPSLRRQALARHLERLPKRVSEMQRFVLVRLTLICLIPAVAQSRSTTEPGERLR